MDDYHEFFGKSLGYPLNAAGEYSMARERLYQKTLESVRGPIQLIAYRVYLGIYTASSFLRITEWNVLTIFEMILFLYGWWLGLKDVNYRDLFAQMGSSTKKGPKRVAKSQVSKKPATKTIARNKEGALKLEHLVLIIVMELQNKEYLTARGDLRFAFFLMHILISIVFIDKFSQAKFMAAVRAGSRILCIFTALKLLSWQEIILNVLFVYVFYFLQVNCLFHANKWMRKIFSRHSINSKLLNQSFQVLDTMPYPVFIFEEKRDKGMPVVYFNLPGSGFITRKEKMVMTETEELRAVNFMDLLDPQDEGQLLECLLDLEKHRDAPKEYSAGLGGLFSSYKSAFTTQIPAELCGEDHPKKYDVILWRMKWMDREVIGAVLNNDAYIPKKGANRFHSKYLEALNAMANQTSNVTEVMINNLRKYMFNNSLDVRSLTDSICASAADLMSLKYLIDNCVAVDKNSESSTVQVFSVKSLVTNIIDWQSKDFKAKGINITLLFEKDFPHFVRAKMLLIRTFLFDIFKYLNLKMAAGSVYLLIETEKLEAASDEEDDPHGIHLKFILSVQGYRLDDLPPSDFLNWDENSVEINQNAGMNRLEIFGSKNPFEQPTEEQLISWIKQIKQLLNVVILKSDDIKVTGGDSSQMA